MNYINVYKWITIFFNMFNNLVGMINKNLIPFVVVILLLSLIVPINAICVNNSPESCPCVTGNINLLNNNDATIPYKTKFGNILYGNFTITNDNDIPINVTLNPSKKEIIVDQNIFVLQPFESQILNFSINLLKQDTDKYKLEVKFSPINYIQCVKDSSSFINILTNITYPNPEAIIRYDYNFKNIIVLGDNRNISINKTEKCLNKKCTLKIDNYALINEYNNSLNIILQHSINNLRDSVTITKIRYNFDKEIKLKLNTFLLIDSKNKLTNQFIDNNQNIITEFNKKTNKTAIKVRENRKTKISNYDGLYFIELETNNGNLNYNLIKDTDLTYPFENYSSTVGCDWRAIITGYIPKCVGFEKGLYFDGNTCRYVHSCQIISNYPSNKRLLTEEECNICEKNSFLNPKDNGNVDFCLSNADCIIVHLGCSNWKAINIKYKNNYTYTLLPKGMICGDGNPPAAICDHNQCISGNTIWCTKNIDCQAYENVGCRIPKLYKYFNFIIFNQTNDYGCKCLNNLCSIINHFN